VPNACRLGFGACHRRRYIPPDCVSIRSAESRSFGVPARAYGIENFGQEVNGSLREVFDNASFGLDGPRGANY
jgi:hypothetical protein